MLRFNGPSVALLLAAVASMPSFSGCAEAATYTLTFTGSRLFSKAGEAPVPGAKKLIMTFSIPPIAAGQCANWTGIYPTALTDGRNTLASLLAAGYLESPGAAATLDICLNRSGKGVTSWFADIGFYKRPNPIDYYAYEAQTGFGPGIPAYDLVDTVAITGGNTITKESVGTGGKWTLVVKP